ncbi:hypothetical protein CLV97_108104 [Planifilum fimeticola]|uniref:Uncharacterized protein n=1 Tax=Planifilum fimeticola TaxID=201975 RepID=A0A2T0LG08_9BACL|nr:hypothetical protein [Planifilum fimeticola]PRX41173.1 hypothetical protein CLV97_108104 [Planifilum fimeticola]
MGFVAFIIALIYTIWFVNCMERIAAHLKGISESLERVQIQLGNIKETMRREQAKKIWSQREEKE